MSIEQLQCQILIEIRHLMPYSLDTIAISVVVIILTVLNNFKVRYHSNLYVRKSPQFAKQRMQQDATLHASQERN